MRRLVVMCILGITVLDAQAEAPAFEVASVKPNRSGSGNSSMNGSQGRIAFENESLKQLIEQAYDVRDFSFSGPNWLDTERFDVVAKPPEGTTPKQFMPMLQTLLMERFKLAVHRKKEERSGYALVLAKGGSRLERATAGAPGSLNSSTSSGRGMMKATATSMAGFADMLARELDQPVQDLTGLAGSYNLKLDWAPDSSVSQSGIDSSAGPSLFTALQEQLGLKLRAQKVSVDVLVVDSAEKVPTEN